MPKTPKTPTADELAERALAGEDVTPHFRKGNMVRIVQRVNLDVTTSMLKELDNEAAAMNVTRQALMKMLLRFALDRFHGDSVASS